jgi:hypothetical protein
MSAGRFTAIPLSTVALTLRVPADKPKNTDKPGDTTSRNPE